MLQELEGYQSVTLTVVVYSCATVVRLSVTYLRTNAMY